MHPLVLALALLLSNAAVAGAGEPPPPDGARKGEPTFAELQGDVTVVSFWATWCPPCVAELPSIAALHAHVGGPTRVVAVSVEDGAGATKARQLFADRKLAIPLLTDGKALYARLFPRAGGHVSVPRIAVLDRSGRGFELEGFDPDEAPDAFVHEVDDVIARVRAGAKQAPRGWRRLRH